tara:strand:+ start:212 stop:379 length:168 start_codon:yes stop_codon:yes gene_type:complete
MVVQVVGVEEVHQEQQAQEIHHQSILHKVLMVVQVVHQMVVILEEAVAVPLSQVQ